MSDGIAGGDGRECARWDLPQIDDLSVAVGGTGRCASPGAGQPGYDEGFARGREEALAAGRQVLQSQVAVLQGLMQSLTAPFTELDAEVETALLELATAVARQVVRRELATGPELIVAIIREAIALLPVAARSITLQMHPDDAQLVRAQLSAPAEEGRWRIVEDAACTRGGCVVTTEHTRIDASLDRQIERIAATVLGAAGAEPVE